MSSPQSATPNARFQSRLNRVAERRAPIEAEKTPVDVLPDWRENAHGPAGLVSAVLVGLVSVVIVRIAGYHLLGTALISDTPGLTLAIELGASFALSLALFFLLPWSGVKYGFLQFGGVAIMALTMHNMVHNAPGLFGLAFSSEWTEDVIARTEPSSMYVRGASIPFTGKIRGEEEEEDVVAAEVATEEPQAPVAPVAEATPEPEEPALPRRIVIGQ